MKQSNIVNANNLVVKRKKRVSEVIFSVLLFAVMLMKVVSSLGG